MAVGKHNGENLFKGLHPTEPVFYLRAQDACSVAAIEAYANKLRHEAHVETQGRVVDDRHDVSGLRTLPPNPESAERLERMARDVDALAALFRAWQENHRERVKLPD